MIELLPYQREGVDALHAFDDRALLADEQGLGKTVQALACLKESKAYPCVIVCPGGLKLHWQKEAREHFGMEASVLYGKRPHGTALLRKEKILIVNYDILHAWTPFLYHLKPKMIIGDEIHAIGNLASRRSKAFRQLCLRTQKILALSGTPLTNKPWELFPILHTLKPKVFDSPFSFGMEYCDAGRSFGKWRFTGAKNLAQLHLLLREIVMVRRKKKDVLPQLPPKTRTIIPIDFKSDKDRKEYEKAEDNFIKWLSEFDLAAAKRASYNERQVRFGGLLRLVARLKLPVVMDWIDSYMKETQDSKLLVGAMHRKSVPIIPTLYGRWRESAVQIHGGCTAYERQESETLFQEDPDVRILFGQIKACGLGLNLTAADTVLVTELPYTPAACVQFEDRPHRLTSVKPLQVVYLIAANTIEEKLCSILQKKVRILDETLDGVEVQDNSLTIFDELQKAILSQRRTRK